MFSHSSNGTNIFIRWKMKCTIQLGFASLNGTFHLSPHENICTIALINIHYLYTIARITQCTLRWLYFRNKRFWFLKSDLLSPLIYTFWNQKIIRIGPYGCRYIKCQCPGNQQLWKQLSLYVLNPVANMAANYVGIKYKQLACNQNKWAMMMRLGTLVEDLKTFMSVSF